MNPETIFALRDLYQTADELYWIASELAHEAKKSFLYDFFLGMKHDLLQFECLNRFI